MAFTGNYLSSSFKLELPQGYHVFGTGGIRASDSFKLAMYTNSASFTAATTAYTATNEVTGTGYTAGGATLTIPAGYPQLSGTTAIFDFDDYTWSASTITARGALIYNATQANRAVAVLDFGSDKSSTSGNFTIQFPTPGASTSIIRIA